MKRFTATELCALALGVVFLAIGLSSVISPHAGIVHHSTNDRMGKTWGMLEV